VRLYVATVSNTPEHVIVMSVLSYLNEGTAAMWADAYLDKLAEKITAPSEYASITLQSFWEKLDEAFMDPNEKRNMQDELERHRQDRLMTAKTFFFKFEQLARRAGYEKGYDQYLTGLLERNLSPGLIDRVYSITPFPTMYIGWKRAATALDQLWRRREERKKMVREFWSTDPKPANSPSPTRQNPSPPPKPAIVWKDTPSGRTYGGLGQPMDLDWAQGPRRCYNCGQEGHIARSCPLPHRQQPGAQVRAVVDSGEKTRCGAPAGPDVDIGKVKSDVDKWSAEEKMRVFEYLMHEKESSGTTPGFQ
jgi:hypothetical protein